MKTRMEKYYDNHEQVTSSRLNKNEHLYKELNDMDFEKFNPNNNAKVIGDNENVIDIEKVKSLLSQNYKEAPKRKSIAIEEEEEATVSMEETKEYNINSVLEKARESKEIDYNKERLKKLRDTQFDILSSLELGKEKQEEPSTTEKEKELMNLINTITSKELANTDKMDPLDILTELKGDDDTKVLSGIEEEVKKEATKSLAETGKVDRSFYTTTNAFTKSDFDDFNDLKDDLKSTKIIVKILIAFVIIAFAIGVLFFINNFFNLQLF